MGCSTYLGLGWRYQPLAPGHPTSICDIGVNLSFYDSSLLNISISVTRLFEWLLELGHIYM